MDISIVNGNQAVAPNIDPVPAEIRVENQEFIKAVKALNGTEVFGQKNELAFLLDRETRRPLIRIVDRETREVIRQIPPEYVLRLAEDLKQER